MQNKHTPIEAKTWIRDFWYNLGDYMSEPLPEHKRVALEKYFQSQADKYEREKGLYQELLYCGRKQT